MTKFILALTVVLGCSSLVPAQMSKKVTAQEKKDLFQLILKDKGVTEFLADFEVGASKLAESLKVEKKDLNKDNQPEYIATLENAYFCGAHANCPQWVYRKTGDKYQLLLNTSGQQLTAQKTLTNNFVDLRSEGSSSAYESAVEIFKFDGSKYVAKQCMTLTYNEKNTKPKITPVKCEEASQ